LTERTIAGLAKRQLADYDAHRPGGIFADGAFTLTVDEAYAVQRRVADLRVARGEAIAGCKIGCISEAVQRQLGLRKPVFGHIFSTELYRSGVVLDANAFEGFAIEGEFAVRLSDDLTPATVFPVIELHNNVFRRSAPTPQELISNNALHAGVVLPSIEIPWPDAGERLALSVFLNGKLLESSTGNEIPGGPLASLSKVIEHLAESEDTLKPGQIVLTGSPLPLYSVHAGDHIIVRGPLETEVELRLRG
jgi:2-keto-4-pentenoate hydratase